MPLERLPALARVLVHDLADLLRARLERSWPDQEPAIHRMFCERIVTQDERAALRLVRTVTDDADEETLRQSIAGLERRLQSKA